MLKANKGDIASVNIGSNRYPKRIYLLIEGYGQAVNKGYTTHYLKTNIENVCIDRESINKVSILKTNQKIEEVVKDKKELNRIRRKLGLNCIDQFSLCKENGMPL